MKKIIVALLLCINTQTHASMCQSLKLSIKNDTPYNCYLIQKSIQSGTIVKRQPYKIKSGATIVQFEVEESNKQPIQITLSYECGENHTIALFSTKSACILSNYGKINATVIKSNNLTAIPTITESSIYSSKANQILWTIS